MTTLAVTYLVVWLSVLLYVARLAARQHRLREQMEAITAQMSADRSRDTVSKAA